MCVCVFDTGVPGLTALIFTLLQGIFYLEVRIHTVLLHRGGTTGSHDLRKERNIWVKNVINVLGMCSETLTPTVTISE